MDAAALIARLQDHYVDQFRDFVREQRAVCSAGASEVKLKLNGSSAMFEQLYCVDFIRNETEAEIIELQPDRVLTFEPMTGAIGAAELTIEHLRWDDVLLRHDQDGLPHGALATWFERWFDPVDARHDPSVELSGLIHSMLVESGVVSIDFGTSEPQAFWDMLELLENAGARCIRVSSSRAEADG